MASPGATRAAEDRYRHGVKRFGGAGAREGRSVNGERRSLALLRPISDTAAHERIRDLVLEVYASHENNATRTARTERSAGAPATGRSGLVHHARRPLDRPSDDA
jgi:hypothetical protein